MDSCGKQGTTYLDGDQIHRGIWNRGIPCTMDLSSVGARRRLQQDVTNSVQHGYPAPATDECIRHHEMCGDNAAYCQILWILILFSWQFEGIGRVSYIRIYLCYFCFRWKTVSLVKASLQYLMHHVTVSLQQSKITWQNNCIINTSITQPTLSFYFWLKM